MASNNSPSLIRPLVQLAAKTKKTSDAVCGELAEITLKLKNLYGVLRRLQEEANKAGSALNRHGATCREGLTASSDNCKLSLSNCDEFLLAYETLNDQEKRLLASRENTPFSSRQKAIMKLFCSQFSHLGIHLSELLVAASMDSLGRTKERMDGAGQAVRFAVNRFTARLIASNDLSMSALVQSHKYEDTLWAKLYDELLGDGFSGSFLAPYRNVILAYVKALERRNAFDSGADSQHDNKGDFCTSPEPDDRDHPKPYGDGEGNQTSTYPKNRENHHRGAPSRKRTRSSGGHSRQIPQETKTETVPSSTDNGAGRGYQFTDPAIVFKKFLEEEEPSLQDDEILADFLKEEDDLNQYSNLRNQMRHICSKLCGEYEARLKTLLNQNPTSTAQKNKEFLSLDFGIEKDVMSELDQPKFGTDELRSLRKKIINKAHRMLRELETAKNGKQ